MSPDLINGLFELVTGLAAWHGCWRLFCDKQMKGFSGLLMWVVTLWGYWNLYYYPHLDQWLSFTAGLVVVSANTTYVWLMVWYSWLGTALDRADNRTRELIRRKYL